MSRTTLGLFGARRSPATSRSSAANDCLSGLTPIERSTIEAMNAKNKAARSV